MSEHEKDLPIEAAQGSLGGLPPIQTGHTSTQPQEGDNDGQGDEVASPPSNVPSPEARKAPVSPQKLEANRKNGSKSLGPRTEAGKKKAAANSYRHGFFAKHLFPTEQAAADKEDYLAVANGVCNHYHPEGFMENLWAEKIATEALRLARLIGFEHGKMMLWRFPFSGNEADRILRYQTRANRGLAEAIKELERLQAKRKDEAILPGPAEAEPEGNDAGGEDKVPTQCPEGQGDGASPDKAIAESGPTVTATEALSEEPEVPGSGAVASSESGGTNPPSAGTSRQTSSPSPNASTGHPQLDEPGSGSPQINESGGTNPLRSLSDLVDKVLHDEGLD